MIMTDRRGALRYLGGLALTAAGVDACAPAPSPHIPTVPKVEVSPTHQANIYNGEIDQLRGRPLITSQELFAITDAQNQTGIPILRKISSDIRALTRTQTQPKEFGSLVANSMPLVMTYDSSGISMTPLKRNDFDLSIGAPGYSVEQVSLVNTIAFGIGLGTKGDPLTNRTTEGLVLARHYVAQMFFLKTADKYTELVERRMGTTISAPSVAEFPVEKDEFMKKAGASLLIESLATRSNSDSDIVKSIPLFLIGACIRDLVMAGRFKPTSSALNTVIEAANLLHADPTTRSEVNRIITLWTNSNGFLPPEEALQHAFFSDNIRNASVRLQDQLASTTNRRS